MMRILKNIFFGFMVCEWLTDKPNLFLWIKFCIDSNITINSQSRLIWANESIIKDIQESKFFGQQEVNSLLSKDRALVSKSSFREVAQVRLLTKEGIIVEGPILKGGMKKVSNADELNRIVHRLSFEARKRGLQITEVEIAHSHKGLEIVILDGNKSQLIMNGLSDGDKKTGNYLGARLHYPLRIKALTERLSYSMIF